MNSAKIPYQHLRYFSNIIKDYLDKKDSVSDLYHRFPDIANFKAQLEEKSAQKNLSHQRKVLKQQLLSQYSEVAVTNSVIDNINLLDAEHTFTITTGHQLNLFTGPLYFFYKIISTLNLCKVLSKEYPDQNFVPVYWMATEDHDFDEIKYFNFGERKLVYDRNSYGAVGRLDTKGLEQVSDQLQLLLGSTKYAEELTKLFANSYTSENLSKATRFLAHELFKNDGLVIIDADDKKLKELAVPFFKAELQHEESFKVVSKTLENWNEEYKIQVNPREINLFYLTDKARYRIIKKENQYFLDGSDQTFSEKEILEQLQYYPERFSPNVIMRPLYQEIILPNLCYIGGGGEIAYWLELKGYFESQEIAFPILLLRNSALLISEKQLEKLEKLHIKSEALFQKDYQLQEQIVNQVSEIEVDFESQKSLLRNQFKELYEIAQQTDPSFEGAVGAQERKQIKGLEHLEKRLLKAQKRKWKDHTARALTIQQELFPNGSLQERQANFSYYYKDHGPELLEILKKSLNPLEFEFTVIEL
jgi:bacillithiol biosynthesis cysteine-adding enzyme BshC